MMNKPVVSCYYTLIELFRAYIDNETNLVINLDHSIQNFDSFLVNYMELATLPNLYTFDAEAGTYSANSHVTEMLQVIFRRYGNQIFTKIKVPYTPWDMQIPEVGSGQVEDEFYKDFYMLLQYLDSTYPKYAKLLDLYETNKNKLMDRLQSIVDAEADTNGTSKYDDTPQTASGTYDDSYSTDVTKSSSHSESGQTTTWDDANIMKRLDEIQKSYDNIMKTWSDNFEQFFWED